MAGVAAFGKYGCFREVLMPVNNDDAGPADAGALFLRRSRSMLTGEYLPKLERALEVLPSTDLWWRPNAASNSVANLMLHLAGNLRQWVVAGVGGATDVRRREVEFSATEGATAAQLLGALRSAVEEADAVLASLDPRHLTQPASIQGRDTTVLEAVYHAVEHFGMHTGQILLLAKLRADRDLGLYRLEDGIPRPTWR